MNFITLPGGTGHYPKDSQAEDAYPNGSRIVKTSFEEGDGNPVGTKGTVLASIKFPEGQKLPDGMKPCEIFYWVKWDTRPLMAVGVVDWKIGLA